MQKAFDRTRPAEREDRAWIQTQIAHLEQLNGNLDVADQHVSMALELFPDYHYALAELGRMRAAQGRLDEAADALPPALRGRAAPGEPV